MAMTAVGQMYRMKPFFDSNAEFGVNVDMYKVKSFEKPNCIASGEGEEVEERLRQLQQRQKTVLTELQRLQHTVQQLAQQRGLVLTVPGSSSSAVPRVSSQAGSGPVQVGGHGGGLEDLVINADPSRLPLSLLVLLPQLSAQRPLLTSTFVHSSAIHTPPQLRGFVTNSSSTAARSSYQLALTVIWKTVPRGPSLMVSPTQQTSIQGEANIARYLSRLMRPSFEDVGIKTACQIDEMLDLAQRQLIEGTSKERGAALRTLNASLGKSQWLVQDRMCVADIVMWSALQQTGLASEAPANVNKWLQRCAQCPEFEEAVQFVSC